MLEKFSIWMSNNTKLSESSIYKYKLAIKTISSDMNENGVIHKRLSDMNQFELDIAINMIFQNSQFMKKNEKGKRMYSNSLKQYRCFIADMIDEIDVCDEVFNTEKIAQTKLRVGQGVYRNGLIAKYSSRCIVTGISHPKLLIASHIKPWSVCEDNERVDIENGLLLSANMDKLFDCGLITFSNTGKLSISSFVGTENEKKLHISNDVFVDLKASKQLLSYLEYHRDVLYVR